MRPIARLRRELLVAGIGQPVVGLLGVVIALVGGGSTARAILPFVGFAAVLAVIQILSGLRWIQRSSRDAPPAAKGVTIETTSGTVRRSVVALSLPLAAVLIVAAVDFEVAAWVGGVPFGVGLVDLGGSRWVARREHVTGDLLFRELGRSPFSGGRRPIYRVPRSASTLET